MVKEKSSDIRWQPIRKGPIYCSPGCGGSCTHKEYQSVISKSKKLHKTMGPEWSIRIWENLGWHYSLQRGPILLYERDGKYSVLIDEEITNPTGGAAIWTENSNSYSDPKKAVLKAIERVNKVVSHLNNVLDSIKAIKTTLISKSNEKGKKHG